MSCSTVFELSSRAMKIRWSRGTTVSLLEVVPVPSLDMYLLAAASSRFCFCLSLFASCLVGWNPSSFGISVFGALSSYELNCFSVLGVCLDEFWFWRGFFAWDDSLPPSFGLLVLEFRAKLACAYERADWVIGVWGLKLNCLGGSIDSSFEVFVFYAKIGDGCLESLNVSV